MRSALVVLLLAACGGGGGGGTLDGGGGGGLDAGVPSELGKSCPMGCNLDTCIDTASTSCTNGICAWDGRAGDSYCTQSCAGAACPAGWECLDAEDGAGQFCFARAAVCGDGVL